MKLNKFHTLILAAAGIATLISGCDLGTKRENAARTRLDNNIAQARLTVARQLIQEGNVEYAKRILEPYAPILSQQATDSILLASTETGENTDNQAAPSQYAKAEEQVPAEDQTW